MALASTPCQGRESRSAHPARPCRGSHVPRPGLAVDDDPLAGARGVGDVECADPITVAALVDRAFALDPATLLSDLVFCHLTRFLIVAFECSHVLAQGIGGGGAGLARLYRAGPVCADQPLPAPLSPPP